MCFYIWNSWTSKKELFSFSELVNCSNCHNVVNPYLLKVTRWQFILLLILPIVFPSSIDYYIVCPICSQGYKINNSDARKMIKEYKNQSLNLNNFEQPKSENVIQEYNTVKCESTSINKKKMTIGIIISVSLLILIVIGSVFFTSSLLNNPSISDDKYTVKETLTYRVDPSLLVGYGWYWEESSSLNIFAKIENRDECKIQFIRIPDNAYYMMEHNGKQLLLKLPGTVYLHPTTSGLIWESEKYSVNRYVLEISDDYLKARLDWYYDGKYINGYNMYTDKYRR